MGLSIKIEHLKKLIKKEIKNEHVKRISISLPPSLLDQFDKYSMNSGFSDRSKSIQTALYEFIDRNEWRGMMIMNVLEPL